MHCANNDAERTGHADETPAVSPSRRDRTRPGLRRPYDHGIARLPVAETTMTATNDHQNAPEESSDRSVDDVLDDLLQALRSDQGGARTEALKRALEQEGALTEGQTGRLAALESTVKKLTRDVAKRDDESIPPAVRTELDDAAEERESLRTAVDSLQRPDADIEARIDTLEDAVADLRERQVAVGTSASELRSELAAARDDLHAADADREGESAEIPTDRSDVDERIDHLEKILNARTSALASKARRVEALEDRIDDLETSVEERTDTLETELETVNSTLEEAATILQSETRDEIEDVRTTLEEQLESLEAEFHSTIESLEDDIDTLEWHAVDMIQWRKAYEEPGEDEENGRETNRE